jgi:uncharacterized protein (DUF58 family)
MGYGSPGHTKADYARTLAATLAYYLTQQRDSVGLLTFDERVADYCAARHRPGHMHQLMTCLERSLQGTGTNLAAPLEQIAALVSKRGLIVLISDLLAPVDALQTSMSYLRARGHGVLVLRVLDRAEIDFTFNHAAMFHDLESGRDLYIDPEAARKEYRSRFDEHDAQVRTICTTLGIDYVRMITDQPLDQALYELLAAQLRQGRHVVRHRQRFASVGGRG